MSTTSEAAGPGAVIVGAGLTAAHVIETLRKNGYARPITLIGDEGELPYERPPLSKSYLMGTKDRAAIHPHPAEWYAERDIDLRLDDAGTAIDRERRVVRLQSGAEVAYAHLVLATGARPRTLGLPGADLPGVHTLRTVQDSTALKNLLAPPKRWAIIGGGWIGLEIAAAAKTAGNEVTVMEVGDLPLLRVMGTQLAEYFADLHRRNGVDLRTNTTVQGIESAGGGKDELTVQTSGGPVPADVVILAVGVAPKVELAEQAGLETDHGIVVDDQLRTSDPQILAAGDVVNARHTVIPGLLRTEHWDNAIRQGRLVGQTILGQGNHYDWQPYFYTDQFDLGMEYVGRHDPSDEVVIRGELAGGEFIAFWRNGEGVLTAAMNVNIWDINDDLRAAIGRNIAAERLQDPAVSLADL